MTSRKPDTRQAMADLIAEIRRRIPLHLGEEALCRDGCQACSLKLITFLESELERWEAALAAGERVGLADLSRLARTARKVHRALAQNGLVSEEA